MLGYVKTPLLTAFHYVLPRFAHKRHLTRTKNREVELRLLPFIVHPERAAVDVGANIGLYSEELSLLCTRVYAFEAHPRLAHILARSLPNNVEVANRAVSSIGDEVVRLNVPMRLGHECDGLSSVETPRRGEKFKSFLVRTIALDDLYEHDIGFVKIDVEGHELSVLSGSRRLIDAQRPTFLVESETRHSPGAPDSVFKFFHALGYVCFFVNGSRLLFGEQFEPEMQDPTKLRNDVPRALVNYSNNFFFVPEERWDPKMMGRLEAELENLL